MGSVKTISIIVAANIKGLESGLGKANKSLTKFASGAARMGSLMTFGITAPLTALGKSAFDAFSEFENGMMKVRAVTSASVGDFKMLTDEAKRLGSTTQFTAQQVSDLQLVLGRKGFDPTAIKNMEQSILDLALATGEDLSLAAEVVASSINAFGMEANDAASIANTLASAAANSSIQLSTFSTAFGHAGASANAVGMEVEELAAMMGVLMDNGIKASKAGTGLRKIFMRLHKEGVKFSDVLDLATQGELGLEKAMKLAGVTSAGQLLILAKNKKRVAELTKEYQTNTTRLDEMTALMGSTAKAKVAIMSSAIEGLKIEMGALIYEGVSPIISKITEWAKAFQELSKDTQKTILKIAGIAAVIGPLLMILALMATAVSAVSTSLKGMWKALVYAAKGVRTLTLAIAKNPLGAIAIVLASIAGAWLLTARNNREANSELDSTAVKAQKAADRLDEINKALANRDKSSDDLLIEEIENLRKAALATLELHRAKLNLGQDEFGFDISGLDAAYLRAQIEELEIELSKYGKTLKTINTIQDEEISGLQTVATEVDELTESYDGLSDSYSSLTGIDFNASGSSGGGSGRVLSGLEKELESGSGKIGEFFDKWGDSINTVGDIFGNMIANKMIAVENSHKKEADLIANSAMTEEQKDAAMTKLNEETAKKKAKLLRKQAIADKAAAIASAIMNGALAVSKTLGQSGFLGIPLAAIVGGLAAVQVATIASAPIPAFAQGGLVTGATMGLVGEGRGTTMSNPEVIAPLDKLKGMLGDSGQQSYIPNVTISGDDLLIVFDRATRRKERR